MNQETSNNRQKRSMSHVQKRQILWNIIQPGDPYDIKKSMIAKLPGDRKNFMGNHLQLVCLLQAAQIERLCQYLQQYKLRYRQIERRQLDRHSYQIQIKQLTAQLSDQNSFKSENFKLRQFLKKQSNQLQELRKKAGSSSDIERNYQKLLIEFQNLRNENNNLINERRSLISDIDQLRAQINAMQNAHRRQMQDLRIQFSDSSKIAFDRERRQLMMKFQSEVSRLEFDNKRLKDSNDAKNRQIEEMQLKIRQMYSQLEQQRVKHQRFSSLQSTIKQYQSRFQLVGQQIQRLNLVLREKTNQLNELYNKYRQFDIQVQRKDSSINEYQLRLKQYQNQIYQYKIITKRLQSDLQQSHQKSNLIGDYESRLMLLSQQVERLNGTLRIKVDQISKMELQYINLQQQCQNYRRRINQVQSSYGSQLKTKISIYEQKTTQLNRRVQEYQNKIALLSQQIERLNVTLKAKVDENAILDQRARSFQNQLQNAKRRINEMDYDVNNNMKNKIIMLQQRLTQSQQQNQDLRRKIKELSDVNRKIAEYQSKITLLSSEVQRLNSVLQKYNKDNNQRANENDQLKGNINGLQSRVDQLINENKRIVEQLRVAQESQRNYSMQINQLNIKITQIIQERDGLQRRVGHLGQQQSTVKRKLQDYENKISLLSQQIERLNGILRAKVDQLGSSQQKMRKMSQEIQTMRVKFTQSETTIVQQWRSKVTIFERDNEQLKRKLAQYQGRMSLMGSQIQRLNGVLKGKGQQATSYEQKYRSLQQQFDNFRNNQAKGMSQQNQQLKRKTIEYERRLGMLSQQIQRLNGALRGKVDELSRNQSKIRQLQGQIQNLKRKGSQVQKTVIFELRSKVTTYQQRITTITQQNDSLRRKIDQLMDGNRKIAQYENRISIMSSQIQRLNQGLRGKMDQLSKYQQKSRNWQQDNDEARRRLNDFQASNIQLKNRIEYIERQNSALKQENDQLKRRLSDLENLNRKLTEYQSRITIFSQQIERLNSILKESHDQKINIEQRNRNLQQQIQNMRRKINESQTTIIQQWRSKYTSIQQQIIIINQQNDELKRRIREFTDINRKIGQYQNKLAIMSQQIDRLNQVLKTKADQNVNLQGRLRNSQNQVENLLRKTKEVETSVFTEYQSRISVYEQKVTTITKDNEQLRYRINQLLQGNKKLADYQNRLQMTSQEIQRLNQNLKGKIDQLNASQIRNRSLQQQLDNYRRKMGDIQNSMNSQIRSKITIYEQQINDNSRKIAQYQNKIGLMSQQIQRLNVKLRQIIDEKNNVDQQLRSASNQLQNARRRISQMQGSINNELRIKITSFEQKITIISQENQQLRVRVSNLSKYEMKCTQLGRQNQRLNGVLRNLQRQLQNKSSQADQLRRRLNDASQINRKIAEYQNKISIMSGQIQRLNQNLRGKMDELNISQNRNRSLQQQLDGFKRRLNDSAGQFQNKASKLMIEIQRLNAVLKQLNQKNYSFSSQLQAIRRKESQYLGDIQRLNNTLRLKVQESTRWKRQYDQLILRCQQIEGRSNASNSEFQKLQVAYNMIIGQYENSKKHLNEYEISIQKLYAQFERLQIIMQDLKKENYQMKQALEQKGGVHEKNRVLSGEIDRLNKIVIELNEQIAQLRIRMSDDVALQKRINEHMALMVILFAEIQSLRKRVRDKQQQVQEVRRSSLAPFKI